METCYLSWDPDDRHAILHCHRPASVADLVAILVERLRGIGEGQALPHTRGFPIPGGAGRRTRCGSRPPATGNCPAAWADPGWPQRSPTRTPTRPATAW
nr:hypothetical protein GCM10010200_051180 [Actinomadura rugatobispora]